MGKINPFPIIPYKLVCLFALLLSVCAVSGARAQVVNRSAVENFLIEGEVGKSQKLLESYLGSPDLTYPDSVYILKNLGVLYSSSPKRKDLGDRYFSRLLDLDPFASIHDTYASNTILARFKKIRKTYQTQKGGKALVPAVVVFDFAGEGISATDGVAMAQQFIAEMQRLEVFHTLDRSGVVESMEKKPVQPEKCVTKECRLDIARRLTADKMVSVQASRLDTVFTFTLAYLDVETGEATTTLTKVYSKRPAKLLAEGLRRPGHRAAEPGSRLPEPERHPGQHGADHRQLAHGRDFLARPAESGQAPHMRKQPRLRDRVQGFRSEARRRADLLPGAAGQSGNDRASLKAGRRRRIRR